MMGHPPWPYPVRLPPQLGLLFNTIETVGTEGKDVAIIIRTRPLPSFRYVLWWCEQEPRLISFPLPDDRTIGQYWTAHDEGITLSLLPPDLLIVPLQKPGGKWYTASYVTCTIVAAMNNLQPGVTVQQVCGLGREPFAELMRLRSNKAIVTLLPRAGHLHSLPAEHTQPSPQHMC